MALQTSAVVNVGNVTRIPTAAALLVTLSSPAGAGPYAGDEAWFYGNGTTARAPLSDPGPGLTWSGTE